MELGREGERERWTRWERERRGKREKRRERKRWPCIRGRESQWAREGG